MSDEDLLQRYAEHSDNGAFAALMNRHGDSVWRFVQTVLQHGDADVAAVCQSVFREAARDARHFSRRASVRTWLMGIAFRRALDELRSRRFHSRSASDDKAQRSLRDDGLVELAGRAERHALEQVLQHLRPETRAVILLRYQVGLSYEEMADVLGEKPGTLHSRVARALPVLRRLLESRGHGGEG